MNFKTDLRSEDSLIRALAPGTIPSSSLPMRLKAFPDGLRIVTGSTYLRNYTGTLEAKAISMSPLDHRHQDSPTPFAQTVSGLTPIVSITAFVRIRSTLSPSTTR